MIKKYFLLLLATILLTGVHGQNRQVDLPKNIPLQDILKKAKKQKKHVLLDFGSPRCSPCLFIKNKIFTIDSVADFINERFVSVDYTEGPEKKRLSKIYEVYTEPVLLICDANGRVMHRMEGKCTAGEMMARLRQGLDVKNNLTAQKLMYDNGNRSSEFLINYLETLHIAGLRTQRDSVLHNIFSPSFHVDSLKTPKYWNVFLCYNESPVSREGSYVFKHREEFYKLFGEQIVNGKIDQMFNGKLRTYTYGQTPPIESKEYRDILECLQNTDYPKSTEWLIYLMPAQYKFKDWMAMVKAIDHAIDLNIPKGKDKQTYMIMMSRQICWYSNNYEALTYALKWIDQAIKSSDDSQKQKLQDEREQIIEKMNELKP